MTRTRQSRSLSRRTFSAATAAAALALTGLLSGCGAGFEATSTKPYSPSDGIMADTGDLRILNTLVVAGASFSSGVVVATIANDGTEADELTEMTSPDGKVDLTGDGTIEPGAAVQLSAGTRAVGDDQQPDQPAGRDDHPAPAVQAGRPGDDQHGRGAGERSLRHDHAGPDPVPT